MTDQSLTSDASPKGLLLLKPTHKNKYHQYQDRQFANIDEWSEFCRMLRRVRRTGNFVYVRFINPGSKRYGSIARVQISAYVRATLSELRKSEGFQLEAHWDNRRNPVRFHMLFEHVEWLPNFRGPTVWSYDRSRREYRMKDISDKLGRKIEVGDFCSYLLYRFDSDGAAGVYFGNVVRIDDDGTVWCKNIALGPDDQVAEKRVKNNNEITVLTKDLMDRLMMAKLQTFSRTL